LAAAAATGAGVAVLRRAPVIRLKNAFIEEPPDFSNK
jgi:hypothetical protein